MNSIDQQNNRSVIGLDLGGTKLAAALFEPAGEKLVFAQALPSRKFETILCVKDHKKVSHADAASKIVGAMAEEIEKLSHGAQTRPVVGVCSPGFMEKGRIIEAWNTGLKNCPLGDLLAKKTGLSVYLYKDSHAPVYALNPVVPSIIISLGTGLGGVSCEPGLSVPLRSYTARRFPTWIPFLYCNDDPGYAISFSLQATEQLIARATGNVLGAGRLALKIKDRAAAAKRVSPSKVEHLVIRGLAPAVAARIKPDEIYADFMCCAGFPALVYELRTGKFIDPYELDKMLVAGDPEAETCFKVLAGFVSDAIFRMQKERLHENLAAAEKVYATGSGYNERTHPALSRWIAARLISLSNENNIKLPAGSESVQLVETGVMQTTFACYGAACGAAKAKKL